MKALGTLIDMIRQSRQGIDENKVLRYDADRAITHDNDLIDKQFVSKYDELLPENADSLEAAALMILSGTTKYTGHLAVDALAAYAGNAPAGSQVAYIIKDASFILQTPNPETGVGDGDKGVVEVLINGAKVDEFDLAAIFDEANRAADQTWTLDNGGSVAQYQSANGNLDIFSVGRYNGFSAFQKVVVRLNLLPADLVVGYNTIQLLHTETASGTQSSDEFEVFYDTETVTPTLDPISVVIEDNSHPKHLSGVRFLGANDAVKVTTAGNKLFANTYVLNPVDFYGNGFPTTTLAPTDASVSGVSNPPVKDEVMVITDKTIVLTVPNQCDADARLTGRPRDPFGTYATVTSPSVLLLLSTFGDSDATNTSEPFNDESYRLPLNWNSDDKTAGITGNWDSETLLVNGNAQQFIIVDNDHGLIYPATDFTGHQPANTANYSAFASDQAYLRAIQGSSAKSSIQVLLDGVTGGISPVGAGDMNVEVKLPGVGGWWDCAKAFGGALGAGDGEGCMVGSISYAGGKATLNVTFGTNSSFGSNYRMYLRITLRNGNRSVKSITTNW